MLPARAAGPVDVDLQVIVVDRDVDLLGLGQHRDGRCAGVDTPAAFGNGDALDAVDAALEFELGEDALPRNAGDHLLVTSYLGLIRRDDFDLPALRICISAVTSYQVVRAQHRPVATGPGAGLTLRGTLRQEERTAEER